MRSFVTSFVKLILITSQLVAETNRLASEGIGTNNPSLVRFFAHFKSADTALWLVLLALNLAGIATLERVAQRAHRTSQRRWRWLYRGTQ